MAEKYQHENPINVRWKRERERKKVDDDDDEDGDDDNDCMKNGLLGNKIVVRFF